MKHTLKFLIVSLLLLVLTGCIEGGGDPTPIIKNETATLKSTGNLNQMYVDEDTVLTPVTIEVVLSNFTENNIDTSKVTWKWYRNDLFIQDNGMLTVTPVLPSTTKIYAIVSYTKDNNPKTITTTDTLVKVGQFDADVSVTAQGYTDSTIKLVLGKDNSRVDFTALVTGNATVNTLEWVITKLDDQGAVISESVETKPLTGQNGVFDYQFNALGLYRVEAKALRFSSNYYYVEVSFGDFLLSANKEVVQSSHYEERVLTAGSIDEAVGAGSYQWYLNDEPLVGQTNKTLTHTHLELGGYRYHVVYTPNNVAIEPQVSEPIVLIYGHLVSTETELEQAIDNKIAGIVLANDILYTKLDEKNPSTGAIIQYGSLVIDYPLALAGNGHTLSSRGIFQFIHVKSDDVILYDITIKKSSRYNVVYENAQRGYVQDVIFDEIGGAAMTDPGAGLYVFRSQVTIKNVEIKQASNSGIRIDFAKMNGNAIEYPSVLNVLGTFKYNTEELAFPIVSVRSSTSEVSVYGKGFEQFILPVGAGALIRRWSNDANPVTWTLGAPNITELAPNSRIDVSGITIAVRLFGSDPMDFGLEFVYLFLSMFKQYGEIRITKLNDEHVKTYYITDFDTTLPGDQLIYQDQPSGGNNVIPNTPGEVGQYKVKVYIGGEMYLGYFVINIS